MIIRTNSLKNVIGLLINGNATESLALLKNVKADIIEISLKIVLTLLLNFCQPSRNSILPSYLSVPFGVYDKWIKVN